MRFVLLLSLPLACAGHPTAQAVTDTLTYDGLVAVPAFIIQSGSITSEGDVGVSLQAFGLRDTYLLPYDGQKPFRFLSAARAGIYSWAGPNYFSFYPAYASFLRGRQPDSLSRRYPTLATRLTQDGAPYANQSIHFAGIARPLRARIGAYWRKRLLDPHFWLLRVTFRYIAAGSTLATVPNLTYRPAPKIPFTQRWVSFQAPIFLITEVLKIAPPYPEK